MVFRHSVCQTVRQGDAAECLTTLSRPNYGICADGVSFAVLCRASVDIAAGRFLTKASIA